LVGTGFSMAVGSEQKNSCSCRESNPGHPVYSQSHYHLSWPLSSVGWLNGGLILIRYVDFKYKHIIH
jgi:hypothetical protein